MRNKKVLTTLFALLVALMLAFTVSVTVFAADAPVIDEPGVDTPGGDLSGGDTPVDDEYYFDDEYDDDTSDVTEESYNDYDDTDEQIDDSDYNNTTENNNEQVSDNNDTDDGLPQVSSEDVEAPTTFEMPDVEVSEISLLGGVIAWLCVAVGIAVLAGVLVSQRTKQVQRPNDNRRR